MSAAAVNQHITCEVDGAFLIVTLNRPDKLNAYTGQMGAEITQAFERADKNDTIRAVIVTGAGRAFCRAPMSRAAPPVSTRRASMTRAYSRARMRAAAALSRQSSTAASRRSRRSMAQPSGSASP
jgi:Enoyl-CoA hydratase/isomerase